MDCDYILIGAGLAGLTLRNALSKDADVIQLDPSPGRWKVGEANSPELFSLDALKPLVPHVRALPSFAKKNGSLFLGTESAAAFPIVSNPEAAVHVARDELEQFLLEHWDPDIRKERVEELDVQERVVRTNQGVYRARRQIIDCSGGAMIVASSLGEISPLWPITAAWKYFDVVRDIPNGFREMLEHQRVQLEFVDIPNINVLAPPQGWNCNESTWVTRVKNGVWMWQIPLFGGTRLSTGFVSRDLSLGPDDLDGFIDEFARPTRELVARDAGGPSPYDNVHTRTGFARRAATAASMNYILIGDAYMFVDPIYSVGTSIAVNKALEVALLLNTGGWTQAKCDGYNDRYERVLQARASAFEAWYDDDSRSNDPNTARVREYFPELSPFQAGIAWHYSKVVQATLKHCRLLRKGFKAAEGRDWTN